MMFNTNFVLNFNNTVTKEILYAQIKNPIAEDSVKIILKIIGNLN